LFTGIVEATGKVIGAEGSDLEVATSIEGLAPGDSIGVNGVCLTVTSLGDGSFSADVSEETRRRTTLGSLSSGARVNLERPLAAGDRLGGHIVQGHVDGTGRVVRIEQLEASTEMSIEVDPSLLRYVIEKGSIGVDGVSLTVTSLGDSDFSVALIPHTLEVTNLGDLRPRDQVNVEVDMMAKYVEKLVKPFREDAP
jgi:riboflavin synthase